MALILGLTALAGPLFDLSTDAADISCAVPRVSRPRFRVYAVSSHLNAPLTRRVRWRFGRWIQPVPRARIPARFLRSLVVAPAQVTCLAVRLGHVPRGPVIAVRLRVNTDPNPTLTPRRCP
ncbi:MULTISPECIES: hypothetical protein [unclassified Micromonospora]|uniref:hypothetical protein n=1 Tax=unclassified Micromonospora TaxID=2617518 RepID=UPI0018906E61|nr:MULTISPECIES: hypothetical protein [unclassified Micromonospora]MBF5028521.1 hypothetical protein [Micromonospora sp. ANENR4]MCZ7473006.1 hypothetical protein [Micromonospora sp. WMMC273]WBC03687.1 hypothetical protein O7546_01535 [Micromonospora sp. WMMA1976]